MSRVTSFGAQATNSTMGSSLTGGLTSSPPIYMEVHFLVDIRIIPQPYEAVSAEAALGLEEGEPWRRGGVKGSEGALLDLLEIRVRHGIGHGAIITAGMLQYPCAVRGKRVRVIRVRRAHCLRARSNSNRRAGVARVAWTSARPADRRRI